MSTAFSLGPLPDDRPPAPHDGPMTSQTRTPRPPAISRTDAASLLRRFWPVLVGLVLLTVPTLKTIAQTSWSTDEGSHGPIVMAIGLWLIWQAVPRMRAVAKPGSAWLGGAVLGGALVLNMLAKVAGSIVIEAGSMYLAVLATLYLFIGPAALRAGWFPLAYMLFVLPPPGRVVAAATQPLRLEISELAVDILSRFGYPVARAGLTLYVDHYELLVKAACAGLNSMISLTAICLFYAYARHGANWRYCLVLLGVGIAMALVANFFRVLILILITYHLGDRAAQGFLHDFSSLTMFAIALSGMLLFDGVAGPLRRWLK